MKHKGNFARTFVVAAVLMVGLLASTPSRAEACASCWLSLLCTYDPYGRTICEDYAGDERCKESGSYCGESDAEAGPEQITADGSVAEVSAAPASSSELAREGNELTPGDARLDKQYSRGCGGVIVGRHFSPSVVASVRRESALVIL
jgi:hypothetical protein